MTKDAEVEKAVAEIKKEFGYLADEKEHERGVSLQVRLTACSTMQATRDCLPQWTSIPPRISRRLGDGHRSQV